MTLPLDIMGERAEGKAVAQAVENPRWQHRFAEVNGVRLHYVEAGAGPLVMLLHGFPEFWYAWRRQILTLAEAGFRVVAPDLRGYNLSDKPAGIAAYAPRLIVDDVRALLTHLGAERASVVGHDLGAGVGWAFAMRHPDALERLAILNGPHPVTMLRAMRRPRQLVKSWYVFLFQLPWLPEYLTRRNGFAMLFSALESLPSAARLSAQEREAYRAAFEEPGALHAMINYYRAMMRPSGAVKMQPIGAEVLVLWGAGDPYLGPELATPLARWVPRARVEIFPDVGHFIQHERPQQVSEHLIRFLRGEGSSRLTSQ